MSTLLHKKIEFQYHLLFDSIFDPIFIYDLEGKIIKINSPALKLIDLDEKLIIGTNIKEYLFDLTTPIVPVDFDEENSYIASFITSYNFNSSPIKMESRMKIIDIEGDTIIMNIMRPFDYDKENEIENNRINQELKQKVFDRTIQLEDALDELRTEIDDRIEVEKALINAKDEVMKSLEKERELSELKTRFISMVSHEYRTPLTAILSTTYILEYLFTHNKKIDFEKQLKKIQKSVKIMTSLLEDVLVVGRNEKYDAIPQFTKTDLVALSYEVIDEIKFVDDFTHNFEISIQEKSLNSIIDSKFMKHILKNLLTNAMKYSERGTNIKFTFHSDGKFSYFSVADTGLGIPKSDQERLFQPFHRSNNVGTISGTGLGLAIVKKFTDALKGEISFETQLKVGSTFYLKVPINGENIKE